MVLTFRKDAITILIYARMCRKGVIDIERTWWTKCPSGIQWWIYKNNQGANKFKKFNVKLHYLYLLMLAIKSVRSYYLFSSNKSSKRLYINMSICIIRFQVVLIDTKICKKLAFLCMTSHTSCIPQLRWVASYHCLIHYLVFWIALC